MLYFNITTERGRGSRSTAQLHVITTTPRGNVVGNLGNQVCGTCASYGVRIHDESQSDKVESKPIGNKFQLQNLPAGCRSLSVEFDSVPGTSNISLTCRRWLFVADKVPADSEENILVGGDTRFYTPNRQVISSIICRKISNAGMAIA